MADNILVGNIDDPDEGKIRSEEEDAPLSGRCRSATISDPASTQKEAHFENWNFEKINNMPLYFQHDAGSHHHVED